MSELNVLDLQKFDEADPTEDMLSPDDMMDYTTEIELMARKETPEQAAARRAEAGKFAGELASITADMTPFVGGAKAASELPEDLSYAKDLVAQGYDEGDLKKMGLGGAFTALSLLGMLPGVKIGADVGKAAIKGSVKDQMENLITPRRAAQLEAAKNLPSSDRRQFLKEINRPTPKVFHGSPEMGKITSVETDVLEESYAKLADNVNYNKNKLFELFVDSDKYVPPSLKKVKELGSTNAQLQASQKAAKDKIDWKTLTGSEDIYITAPKNLRTKQPGTYIPEEKQVRFKYDETGEGFTIDSESDFLTELKWDDSSVGDKPFLRVYVEGNERGIIPINKDGTVSRNDVLFKFNELNEAEYNKSSISKLNIAGMDEPRSKGERLVQEGFKPYSEFEGDIGLGMSEATGKHHELVKQMLSTSRDPLVSLKGGFANFDPSNVVYAPLKKGDVKGMKPELYDDISTYGIGEGRLDKIPDQPVGIPASTHLEAEVALSKPEQLESIRRLSTESRDVSPNLGDDFYYAKREGMLPEFRKTEEEKISRFRRTLENTPNLGKLSLEDRVLAGQEMANSLVRRENLLHISFGKYGQEQRPTKATAKIYYDDVRSYFKDLQSLGQYTEQYGARGTYDKFLRDQAERITRRGDFESNLKELRNTRTLPPEKMTTLDIIYDTLKAIGRERYAAPNMNYSALRGISDRELLDFFYRQKVGDKILAGDLFKFGLEVRRPDGTIKQQGVYLDYDKLGGKDLKRLMFLATQKLNRGGLMSKK